MVQAVTLPPQRFHSILGDALHVGLETTLLKSELPALSKKIEDFKKELKSNSLRVVIRDPNAWGDKPDAKTISVINSGDGTNFGIAKQLLTPIEDALAEEILFGDFVATAGLPALFQRLNFKQTPSRDVLGLICGRHGETAPFPIRLRTQSPTERVGYANLDFLSKTKTWNPIFVKYRLCTAMKDLETGYVKIDASKTTLPTPEDRPQIDLTMVTVSCYRVPESEVPEFLKVAKTFPE